MYIMQNLYLHNSFLIKKKKRKKKTMTIITIVIIKINCKNCHIGHCPRNSGRANVKAQNIFHWRNNITCSAICQFRTAATLYTLETWFVSGMCL